MCTAFSWDRPVDQRPPLPVRRRRRAVATAAIPAGWPGASKPARPDVVRLVPPGADGAFSRIRLPSGDVPPEVAADDVQRHFSCRGDSHHEDDSLSDREAAAEATEFADC